MLPSPARQRVVIVGQAGPADCLAGLFSHPALQSWDPLVADSPEHARFCSQWQTCGAVLADQSALESATDGVLGWLGARTPTPVVFLSESDPDLLRHALAQNVHLWLPRPLVLGRPVLLAEGLRNVQQRRTPDAGHAEAAADCQSRIDRLAHLLWTALPIDGRTGWLTQRCLLERLREETGRAARHNTPLTLVLAELDGESGCGNEGEVNTWVAERLLRGKRGSDVAGQYGTRGFMLLLPHTADNGAQEVCRRLRRDLEQAPWHMHASFGVASYSSANNSPKSLLRLAEEGLDRTREPG